MWHIKHLAQWYILQTSLLSHCFNSAIRPQGQHAQGPPSQGFLNAHPLQSTPVTPGSLAPIQVLVCWDSEHREASGWVQKREFTKSSGYEIAPPVCSSPTPVWPLRKPAENQRVTLMEKKKQQKPQALPHPCVHLLFWNWVFFILLKW